MNRNHSRILLLNDIAGERGQSLAQFALSWILKDKDITSVLIGASRPSQIKDCVTCLENTDFSTDELKKIDDINCKITDGDKLIPIALTYHQNESMWTIPK